MHWKPNQLEQLVESNLEKEWNWGYLSDNPNITQDFILKYSNKPWDWQTLSRKINKHINWNLVSQLPDKPWNWSCLSAMSKDIDWTLMEQHPEFEWDYVRLSILILNNNRWDIIKRNPNLPWSWEFNLGLYGEKEDNLGCDFIKKYPNKHWNWKYLSQQNYLDWCLVKQEYFQDWDWYSLSYLDNIDWECVKLFFEKKWNWTKLSNHPKLDYNILFSTCFNYWNWMEISDRTDLPVDRVVEYSYLPWHWNYIIQNYKYTLKWNHIQFLLLKNINWNLLVVNPNIKPHNARWLFQTTLNMPYLWDRYCSRNPNINLDFITNHQAEVLGYSYLAIYPQSYNWYYLSQNPNFTWKIIVGNPQYPWNFNGLSCNPNISMEIIEHNSNMPWNWREISLNKFQEDPVLQYLMARRIQKMFRSYLTTKKTKAGLFIYDFIFDIITRPGGWLYLKKKKSFEEKITKFKF